MFECCGSVSLNKKMANPRGAITRNESQWKQPPSATDNKVNHTGYPDTGADQMEQASGALAMFGHVVRPEFTERVEVPISHKIIRSTKECSSPSNYLRPVGVCTVCVSNGTESYSSPKTRR
jgi:hypothetical protein